MKYFLLQCKRTARLLPFVFVILSLLLSAAFIVFSAFGKYTSSKTKNKFKIGVVGEAESNFFDFGISALQTMDTSRYSIDLEMMDEKTAKKKLLKNEISAYIVIPDGFVDAIEYGEIIPISYCTSVSSVTVSSIMKDEITDVISTYLKQSQKGVYGLSELLDNNGYERISNLKMNQLYIEYVDFILDRSKIYKTDITGTFSGLRLPEYLLIGSAVVFICIAIIPFAALQVKEDNSISKLLCSKGFSPVSQIVSEYLAAFLGFAFITGIFIGIAAIANELLNLDAKTFLSIDYNAVFLHLFPITALLIAFAFLIFELFGNLISSITGYFFLSVALSFVSGCMYPLYALPLTLQKIAVFTPFGLSRKLMSDAALSESTAITVLLAFVYTAALVALTVLIRKKHIEK